MEYQEWKKKKERSDNAWTGIIILAFICFWPAGIALVVLKNAGKLPILGVCLGHQAICEAFGGTVSYAKQLMHGKQKEIRQCAENRLFRDLPETFPAAR